MNKLLSAKSWGIWLKRPQYLWAKLWLPILAQDVRADTFLSSDTQVGMTKVAEYWQENSTNATWRCW